MILITSILLTSLLFLMLPVEAAEKSTITVQGLNYPVWLERKQILLAVTPGSELYDGDIIKTGEPGRVWLSMKDGSVVKLGQNTVFKITSASYDEVENFGLLRASLNVIKGKFRFTSGFFNPKINSSHHLNIKIGTITAGIRGTDIWGRSTENEDLVTLFEGSISVTNETGGITILDQPQSLFVKKQNLPIDPISKINLTQFNQLAKETELSTEQAIARTDGQYDLVLISLKNSEIVDRLKSRLQRAGYAAELESININGVEFTRLLLSGFIGYNNAKKLAQRLQDEFQFKNIWVKNRNIKTSAQAN